MMMVSIPQQQQKLYYSPNSHISLASTARSLLSSTSTSTSNSTSPSSSQCNSTKLEGSYEFPPYQTLKPISIDSTAPPSPPRSKVNALSPISPLATFTGEMISWIWFKSSVKGKEVSRNQAVPSEKFLRFCHEVLATTQVSQSVVVLALLFIHKLKSRNSIEGALGSEFRLATTALMMSNKILDDNTYTAKTWAEVSSLELEKLVSAEAEFLKGLDFQLHATEKEYNDWTKILEGHVAARRSLLRQSDTRRTGSILNENNVARVARPLVGLGLSAVVPFDYLHSQELEPRRHSAVEQRYPALYNFSFPPRHSSLSHVTSYTPSMTSSVYTPITLPQTSSNSFGHTRTRSYTPPIQNSTPSSKRRASDAFSDEEALHPLPNSKRCLPSWGSYSVGSSPQQPAVPLLSSSIGEFVFPSNPNSTLQYSNGSFHHLVDPFSPIHLPNHTQIRHENLSFYCLAAGQRQGLPRQALPIDPVHFNSQPLSYNTTPKYQPSTTRYHSLSPSQIPQYHVSPYRTSPSYINRPQPSQSPLYSPARSLPSRSPTDYYSSTPPHSGYGSIPYENQPIYYSQFSNAIPATYWPQVLASQ